MGERDFIEQLTANQNTDGAFVGPFTQSQKKGPKHPSELQEKPAHTVLPFTHHLDVFVVFRPWESCRRCKKVWEETGENPEGEEPDDSDDFSCPHTRRTQYLALMQKCMKDGFRCISRKAETLKSGVIQISVEWWVPDAKKLELVPVTPRSRL